MSDTAVKLPVPVGIQIVSSFTVSCSLLFPGIRKTQQALLLVFFSMILSWSAMAQQDTNNYDVGSANDTLLEAKDDTSGYYFNWKENTNQAYTNQKLQVRVSSDTTVQQLKKDDDFWYVKSIDDFKKNAARLRYDRKYHDSLLKEGLLPPDEEVFTQEQESNVWYMQPWFINVIWGIIIAIFIAAVVFFLSSNKINLFNRSAARADTGDTISEENLFSIKYDALLLKYMDEKNFRLAVRVLYLQLLKMLSERNVITFQPHYTNTHYLRQVAGSDLYQDFFTVTRHYEYIWYGEFAVNEALFQKINADFANLKKQLSQP